MPLPWNLIYYILTIKALALKLLFETKGKLLFKNTNLAEIHPKVMNNLN